jgi:predicted porin
VTPKRHCVGISATMRCLAVALLWSAAVDLSHAAEDHALTAFGLTLYGTVDIGLQYDTHGVPVSDYYVEGTAAFIRPNDNRSVLAFTPSNLGQSVIGLEGRESLYPGWSGVFKLESFFNPQSGQISDGLKSLALNNGRESNQQITGLDTSVAGESFETAYAGIDSRTYGSLLFGRMTTILSDGIAKYDPQRVSATFSLLGAQGTAAGGGDTENRRISSSLKYVVKVADFHFGAESKFGHIGSAPKSVSQVNLGADVGRATLDAYFSRIKGAIAASSLSFVQVSALSAMGFAPSTALAGTISDNTALAFMAMTDVGLVKGYAGYEFIRFTNPSTPLAPGFEDIGGYTLAFVNNAAYGLSRDLQIFWAGVRYEAYADLDLALGYYGYRQNSYATGANANCSTDASAGCSGTEGAVSAAADYRLSKRFDAYLGAMYSDVTSGLASGYLHRSMLASTVGLRIEF